MVSSLPPLDDFPPKRGKPPAFRRNRFASALAFCAFAFAAGMGLQWGMGRVREPSIAEQAEAGPRTVRVDTSPERRAPSPPPKRIHTWPPTEVGPPAAAAAEAATPGPVTVAETVPPAEGPDAQPVPPMQAAAAPPAPPPAASAEPAARPKPRPATTLVRSSPRPAPKPARKAVVVASTEPAAQPRPVRAGLTAPAATAPRVRVSPSFDCARASTPGERQVCRDPRLQALDARMDAAFRRALAQARDPRGLKADQDRWMAVREGAALRDPSMVGPAYERRIAELNGTSW